MLNLKPKEMNYGVIMRVSNAMGRLGYVRSKSGGVPRWVTAAENAAKTTAFPRAARGTVKRQLTPRKPKF